MSPARCARRCRRGRPSSTAASARRSRRRRLTALPPAADRRAVVGRRDAGETPACRWPSVHGDRPRGRCHRRVARAVLGGLPSRRTTQLAIVSMLPATSVDWYSTVCSPLLRAALPGREVDARPGPPGAAVDAVRGRGDTGPGVGRRQGAPWRRGARRRRRCRRSRGSGHVEADHVGPCVHVAAGVLVLTVDGLGAVTGGQRPAGPRRRVRLPAAPRELSFEKRICVALTIAELSVTVGDFVQARRRSTCTCRHRRPRAVDPDDAGDVVGRQRALLRRRG